MPNHIINNPDRTDIVSADPQDRPSTNSGSRLPKLGSSFHVQLLAALLATVGTPAISHAQNGKPGATDLNAVPKKPKLMKEIRNVRGTTGLEVHLEVPDSHSNGTLCEGDEYDFTVRTEHSGTHKPVPAWIRVYSIVDGRAILGWKSEKPETTWTRNAIAVPLPGASRTERLLVVAIPAEMLERNEFGTAPEEEGCFGEDDALKIEGLPRAAAVAEIGYQFDAGKPNCPDDTERKDLVKRGQRYLARLPKCQ